MASWGTTGHAAPVRWWLSVVWLDGFASLFAVPLAILALTSGEIGRSDCSAAVGGLVQGVAGLALSAFLAFRFGLSTL